MKYIAEIGWNFLGDLALANKMVTAASSAGAHYAKFQWWNPDNLKSGPWDNDGRREIYQSSYLTEEKIYDLKEICEQHNVGFFVSVFEMDTLDKLRSIDTSIVKIPSHECTTFSLIDRAIDCFDRVIVSIGALTKDDLDAFVNRYNKQPNLEVMHCVSSYPLAAENVNLPKLKFLLQNFNTVGYSSHFQGTLDVVVASILGATIIEKHFTTDHSLPGRDNKFALLGDDFAKMVSDVGLAKKFLVDCGLDIQDCEKDVAQIMRGRWSGGSGA